MKGKIAAGILLALTVLTGFFLPNLASGIQDLVENSRELRYDLPIAAATPVPSAAPDAGSQEESPSPDERIALLLAYRDGVFYPLSGASADEETVAAHADAAFSALREAGILQPGAQKILSAQTELVYIPGETEQTRIVWRYTGQTTQEDVISMRIDAQSGLIVSLTARIGVQSPQESLSERLGLWSDFLSSYYGAAQLSISESEQVSVLGQQEVLNHSGQYTVSLTGEDGLSVLLPFRADQLFEAVAQDSTIAVSSLIWIFRFNE